MLTNEELRQAKELSIMLKTQDNRGTRAPVLFLLQDAEEKRAFDSGDFVLFSDDCGEIWRGDSEEDIIKQILEIRKEDIEANIAEFGHEEVFDKEEARVEEEIREEVEGNCYEMEWEFVTKQIFLTEEAAKEHLRLNPHHYSEKARIYVDHAWRNPEMELVQKILTTYF